MENGQLIWSANLIRGVADDVPRKIHVRGNFRDMTLPMAVVRRLDALLGPVKGSGVTVEDAAGAEA